MPYRDSPYQKIKTFISFNYLNLFKPNEHTEGYNIRKPNYDNILSKIADERKIFAGKFFISFGTNVKIVKCSSELGFTVLTILNTRLLTVRKIFFYATSEKYSYQRR